MANNKRRRWDTVAICPKCWRAANGDREPVHLTQPPPETCHFCGEPTGAGIYVRAIVTETDGR